MPEFGKTLRKDCERAYATVAATWKQENKPVCYEPLVTTDQFYGFDETIVVLIGIKISSKLLK